MYISYKLEIINIGGKISKKQPVHLNWDTLSTSGCYRFVLEGSVYTADFKLR